MIWVLVTGDRRWPATPAGRRPVRAALLDARDRHGGDIGVRHGAAEGLDTIADDEARLLGLPVDPHPADWPTCTPRCKPGHRRRRRDGTPYCPTAGHRRNNRMIRMDPPPGECLGFPLKPFDEGGTWGCMKLADAAGLPVWRVFPDGTSGLLIPRSQLAPRLSQLALPNWSPE